MSTHDSDIPRLTGEQVDERYAKLVHDPRMLGTYEQVRTREELDRLLHYGHFIPIGHGFTAKFVAENYPGWTWNQLIDTLSAAGVVVFRGGTPPCCRDDVVRVEFDSPVGWRVLWTDGHVTRGPAEPGLSTRPRRPAPTPRCSTWAGRASWSPTRTDPDGTAGCRGRLAAASRP